MAKVKKSLSRLPRSVDEPYIVFFLRTRKDGESGRDACVWDVIGHRSCQAAARWLVRERADDIRYAIEQGEPPKQVLSLMPNELGVVVRGNDVAGYVKFELAEGNLWSSATCLETGQVVKEVVEIPHESHNARRSA
jgi:hypothetical protein